MGGCCSPVETLQDTRGSQGWETGRIWRNVSRLTKDTSSVRSGTAVRNVDRDEAACLPALRQMEEPFLSLEHLCLTWDPKRATERIGDVKATRCVLERKYFYSSGAPCSSLTEVCRDFHHCMIQCSMTSGWLSSKDMVRVLSGASEAKPASVSWVTWGRASRLLEPLFSDVANAWKYI